MSDHEINVKVNLDDSEAQKKLNDLTKKERKIDIDVDTSDIDQASKLPERKLLILLQKVWIKLQKVLQVLEIR